MAERPGRRLGERGFARRGDDVPKVSGEPVNLTDVFAEFGVGELIDGVHAPEPVPQVGGIYQTKDPSVQVPHVPRE